MGGKPVSSKNTIEISKQIAEDLFYTSKNYLKWKTLCIMVLHNQDYKLICSSESNLIIVHDGNLIWICNDIIVAVMICSKMKRLFCIMYELLSTAEINSKLKIVSHIMLRMNEHILEDDIIKECENVFPIYDEISKLLPNRYHELVIILTDYLLKK